MSQNITQYDLLISCPGDITDEIKLIEETVEKFNEQFSDNLGIAIRTRHWSKSSYAQSGGKPQDLLNDQFVKKCDAAVALLWTRFGTPTDKYGSGTEEEIEIMLNSGKQVFMYFSDKPISLNNVDMSEYQRVKLFQEKYKDLGIYGTYSSHEEFAKMFYAHLTKYFMTLKSDAEKEAKRSSNLLLRGIDKKGKLSEVAELYTFRLNSPNSKALVLEEIQDRYAKINALHMGTYVDPSSCSGAYGKFMPCIPIYPPVTIEKDTMEIITAAAEKFDISLSSDFFNLGNLSKDPISASLGSVKYYGTPNEKEKYHLITNLYKLICKYLNWSEIENAFSEMKCIRLAVENNGTAVDEDVEIEIRIPESTFWPVQDFPEVKSDSAIEFLIDHCGISTLFSISPTAQYKEYDDSIPVGSAKNTAVAPHSFNPFYGRDLQQKYWNKLKRTYLYEVFEDGEDCVLKVRFGYVKHHTVIAFPTPLFFKIPPSKIIYTISSRNSADVISDSLKCIEDG